MRRSTGETAAGRAGGTRRGWRREDHLRDWSAGGIGCDRGFVSIFLLNLAGLPGALRAELPRHGTRYRVLLGAGVATLGQSYVYLEFVAFVVNWTRLAAARPDILGLVLWPVAFLVIVIQVWHNMMRAPTAS